MLDWGIFDDGWRFCDRCDGGFTIWEDWMDWRPQDCGYHEKSDQMLCEDCWEEVEKNGDE